MVSAAYMPGPGVFCTSLGGMLNRSPNLYRCPRSPLLVPYDVVIAPDPANRRPESGSRRRSAERSWLSVSALFGSPRSNFGISGLYAHGPGTLVAGLPNRPDLPHLNAGASGMIGNIHSPTGCYGVRHSELVLRRRILFFFFRSLLSWVELRALPSVSLLRRSPYFFYPQKSSRKTN